VRLLCASAGRAVVALLAFCAFVLLVCGAAVAAPLGTFTQFPVPTTRSDPIGIAAAPDGDLWFTESGNKIGRITPTGSITEFPLPTAHSHAFWIAAAPDGDLWFTESNKIGRITPTGSITEFPIPTADSGPYGIAAGPDGDLWFTELSGNKIGLVGDGPPAAKVTRAKISSKHGAAIFSFKAIGAATGFQCALVTRRKHRKQPKPHFSSCKSPKTYKHLKSGKYTFEVRALDAADHGTPVGKSFKIS
jgi:streptogramin lyase